MTIPMKFNLLATPLTPARKSSSNKGQRVLLVDDVVFIDTVATMKTITLSTKETT
jgi:hypoxanthine phosphoribosyltransferase